MKTPLHPLWLALASSLFATLGCVAPMESSELPLENSHGLEWTLGSWSGTRTGAERGVPEPMLMHVRPMLGGAGQVRELSIQGDPGSDPYEGFCAQVYDSKRKLWVREYSNAFRGKFTELEGALVPGGDPHTTLWTVSSPTRTRETRLYSEHPTPDTWIRTMTISRDGGATWSTLWTDELVRGR